MSGRGRWAGLFIARGGVRVSCSTRCCHAPSILSGRARHGVAAIGQLNARVLGRSTEGSMVLSPRRKPLEAHAGTVVRSSVAGERSHSECVPQGRKKAAQCWLMCGVGWQREKRKSEGAVVGERAG